LLGIRPSDWADCCIRLHFSTFSTRNSSSMSLNKWYDKKLISD
jgi:hypothetical protein